MKRAGIAAIVAAVALVIAATAVAGDYRYVKADVFREWLETGKQMIIVDIQEPAAFQRHHFRDAVETNAYPVKTEEERRRLDPVLKQIIASSREVVIVCPRGGGGAKNSYDYLQGKGVDPSRLLILEKGMEGWSYPEAVVKGEGKR